MKTQLKRTQFRSFSGISFSRISFFWIVALSMLLAGLGAPAAHADDQLHQQARYTLRSGDQLVLNYRITPELNQTVTVLPDGHVNLNVVGDLDVAGMTIEQAQTAIVQRATTKLNDPELSITLVSFAGPYVVVAGEVLKPGRLNIRENTTALQAILDSGGFLETAQDSQVLLFRKINSDVAEIKVLHLNKLHKTVDLKRDLVLQPGDMLYVPRDKITKISHYIKVLNLGLYFNPAVLL